MVMWVLLWIHLMNGKLEYYQLGAYQVEKACYDERQKAKMLVKDQNSGLFCVQVTGSQK